MIVERVEHAEWFTNAYLVADGPGGSGVIVDSNGLTDSLMHRVETDRITITHVLCTHGHADHVVKIGELARHLGAPLLAHPECGVDGSEPVRDGCMLRSGKLVIRAMYTPGHCPDHIAFLVDGTHCLTADALFAGTVGGTAGPGGDLAQLKHSILDVLLQLRPETIVLPGHRAATTIAAERETNPFIRAWLDGEELLEAPCRVRGEEATLLVWALDYDGGHKALVRLSSGLETILGGSQVERR